MLLSQAINTAFKGYLTLQNSIQNDFELSGIAPLESATSTQISYIDQDKYIASLADSKAGAVLINFIQLRLQNPIALRFKLYKFAMFML